MLDKALCPAGLMIASAVLFFFRFRFPGWARSHPLTHEGDGKGGMPGGQRLATAAS